MISKDLLDILCCPETKADLVLDGNFLVSVDKATRRRYRIEDDIPIMLIEESEQLDMETWKGIMKRHGRNVEE
ncbi:MAG: Trm112 family protein [Ignavibacteriales bacterium]